MDYAMYIYICGLKTPGMLVLGFAGQTMDLVVDARTWGRGYSKLMAALL